MDKININIALVEKIYDDLVSPTAKVIGNNLAKICQSIFDFFPVAKIHLCNCSKKVLEQLSDKINNIKQENFQIPDARLFLKSIECLQYRDDKDLITQMFINLITNECDKTKADKVHPALIEILNKMSKEEAMYLYKNKKKLSSGKCGDAIMFCRYGEENKKEKEPEYDILLCLLSHGLLTNACGGLLDNKGAVTFLPTKVPLLFLLLEIIPDNLDFETKE